jgi:hypothetical protein
MFLSFLAVLPLLCASTTHVVDAGGAGTFLTIQSAIDASLAGDLIQINPGTYEEDLIVDVSVTIFAQTPGTVTIYPATSNAGTGVGGQVGTTTQSCLIRAHDVTLEDLLFIGDNPNFSPQFDARNGIVTDYESGTWDRLTVRRCTARKYLHRAFYVVNGTGHFLVDCIARRTLSMGFESCGFMIYRASAEVINCTATDCGIGIATHNGSTVVLDSNYAESCELGILCNGTPAASTVTNNELVDCDQGIQLIGTRAHIDVTNNLFLRNRWGLSYFGSNGTATIANNLFDADGELGLTGIHAMTDLAPWGVNDVRGTVTNNQFLGMEIGIILDETVGLQSNVIDLTIGGAPDEGNSFFGSSAHNLFLDHCDDPINATYNNWGVPKGGDIEATIFHHFDDANLGLVDFSSSVFELLLEASGIVANQMGAFTLTGATPLSTVMLVVSTTGPGPESSPYGDLYISSPHFFLPNMTSSSSGVASTHIMVDPNYVGRTFWMQGFDLASKTLSNGIEVLVLN